MARLVLVVDDEPLIIETLSEVLAWEGYEVIRASNGSDALEAIGSRIPDLLLIDFMMPLKDGVTTIAELRQSPRTAEMPIILMTAAPGAVPADARLHDLLLVKPFTVKELRAALRVVFPPEH